MSRVLHSVTFINNGAVASSGLVKFGVAFERGDIPNGFIPAATVDGSVMRSSIIDGATWSDGSLRKATIAVDLGTVNAAVSLELRAVSAMQSVNTFDVASFVAGLQDDCTVQIVNRVGSASGAKPDLTFSLKTAYSSGGNVETTNNTRLLVRSQCWQKAVGEEHLVCLHYLDTWLDATGNDVAYEWVPVLSQHWWVNDPFGIEQAKERYTYDATVSIGSTVIDSRSSLSHAYYCRWASLYSGNDDQHATPHWVELGTAKPTMRMEYSVSSRKKLHRTGYCPPLNWSDSSWVLTSTSTYAPLSTNGHRASINDGGGYIGRGAITRPDANAIGLQTAASWRIARVAANASLSGYFHALDHRVVDSQPSPGLIPQKFPHLGARSYERLGAETYHSKGTLGLNSLPEDAAVGGTGAFANYDSAHQVNYAHFMAFITGERYLFDSAMSEFHNSTSSQHINQFGLLPFHQYAGTPRGTRYGVPTGTHYGVMGSMTQQRAKGWYGNGLLWAWGLLADDDPHKPYLDNAVQDYGDWFADSLNYFPADNLAYGGFDHGGSGNLLLWMQAFGVLAMQQWLTAIEDAGLGSGGYRRYIAVVSKLIENAIESGRIYSIGSFIQVAPANYTMVDYIPGERDLFVHHNVTCTDGAFTIVPLAGLTVANGDKVVMSRVNANNAIVVPPVGFSYGVLYYTVGVSGNTFRLSTTPGGQSISSLGITSAAIGISAQSYVVAIAGTNGASIPSADSYFSIVWAASVSACICGMLNKSACMEFSRFMEPVKLSNHGPWNYNEDQAEMARSARITKIDRRGQRCTLLNYRSGGEKYQIEVLGGMSEFRDWIREQLKDNADTLIALGLAQWLAKNPGSTDFSAIEGKTITLDLTAAATTGLVTIV